MPLWHAVILGVVQGLTEFLPISSTAHLIVVQRLLGQSDAQVKNDPFSIVIQLGTLVAVVIYFRSDLWLMAKMLGQDIYHKHLFTHRSPEAKLAKLIIVGTVPAVVCGVLFQSTLKKHFYAPLPIGIISIVFALLLLASEWRSRKQQARGIAPRSEREIGLFDAILIGVFQALALMPGASRSGTTITAGLFAGLGRPAAARFSFLLSVPVILGAGLKEAYDGRNALMNADNLLALGVGLAVTAVVGYGVIAWLINFLKKFSTVSFIIYRLVFGAILIALAMSGWFER